MTQDDSILRKASSESLAGRPVVLCIVTEKKGSAPRDVGSKMLVLKDRSTLGTIGGGSFERQVITDAFQVFKTGKSKTIKYSCCQYFPIIWFFPLYRSKILSYWDIFREEKCNQIKFWSN